MPDFTDEEVGLGPSFYKPTTAMNQPPPVELSDADVGLAPPKRALGAGEIVRRAGSSFVNAANAYGAAPIVAGARILDIANNALGLRQGQPSYTDIAGERFVEPSLQQVERNSIQPGETAGPVGTVALGAAPEFGKTVPDIIYGGGLAGATRRDFMEGPGGLVLTAATANAAPALSAAMGGGAIGAAGTGAMLGGGTAAVSGASPADIAKAAAIGGATGYVGNQVGGMVGGETAPSFADTNAATGPEAFGSSQLPEPPAPIADFTPPPEPQYTPAPTDLASSFQQALEPQQPIAAEPPAQPAPQLPPAEASSFGNGVFDNTYGNTFVPEPQPPAAQSFPIPEPAPIEQAALPPESPVEQPIFAQPEQTPAFTPPSPPADVASSLNHALEQETLPIDYSQPVQQVNVSAPPLPQEPVQVASLTSDVPMPVFDNGNSLGSGLTIGAHGQGLQLPTESTPPSLPDMGGAQGITPPPSASIGDQGSFINTGGSAVPPPFITPQEPPALGSGITTPKSPEGQGFHPQEVPNVDAMGGGQGLVVPSNSSIGDPGSFVNSPDLTNPFTPGLVTQGGFTPIGAVPSIGDPGSFINSPNETGQPVVGNSNPPADIPPAAPGNSAVDQAKNAGSKAIDFVKENALPIAAAGSLISAANQPGPVSDPGADARAAEEARLARAADARKRVNDAFAGYGDDYYGDIAKRFRDYYTPQLKEAYDDATRQTLYAAPGGVGSTEFARQLGRVETNRERDFADLAARASDSAEQVRGQIAGQKANLLSEADTAQDPESLGDTAVSLAQAAARPQPYSPIADLFGRFTALGANAAIANANNGRGYTPFLPQTDPYFFGRSGRNGGGSVKVIGG